MTLQSNILRDGFGRLIKQKYIYIAKSAAGTHELITTTEKKRIKVLRFAVFAAGAFTLLSGTDTIMRLKFTTKAQAANFVQTDGIPVAITDLGEALQVTVGTVPTRFYIQYVLVD